MESFIPDEIAEEAANAPADATSETAESVRMEPGYYRCHPVWAKDTKKDGTPVDANNIAVRIGFRPYETAAFGARGEALDDGHDQEEDAQAEGDVGGVVHVAGSWSGAAGGVRGARPVSSAASRTISGVTACAPAA